MRSGRRLGGVALAVATLVAAVVLATPSGAAERALPLGGGTGLRLVVADFPPFVLDVDTKRMTRVRGVPRQRRGSLHVVGVGGHSAVVVLDAGRHTKLYAVRRGRAMVASLGIGEKVTPAREGRAVWVQTRLDPFHCTLRQIALGGRALRAARPFPCSSGSEPIGGSLGLVVRRTNVVDPLTGRRILRTGAGILAAAGQKLLLAGPGEDFTLLDSSTGAERLLRCRSKNPCRPSSVADPGGRFAALAFRAVPGGPRQAFDVWVLDSVTGKLTQVLGLPSANPKRTNLAWTDDGRLVVLGETLEEKAFIGVWRPGRPRFATKAVDLPQRRGGSSSFAPVR